MVRQGNLERFEHGAQSALNPDDTRSATVRFRISPLMLIKTMWGAQQGIRVGTIWLYYHDDVLVIGYERGAYVAGLRTWFFATGLDIP